ncbi:BolA family protein [Nioella nitratireducens]|uniref:BolA family protein n=1 Tax=Nioella nitratireducens TaxID=1287720 RepID=UPI0008FD0FEE|nr:BolA family protein [Nioella nitratireducens]
MSRAEKIRTRLETALSPRRLQVIDESESHRGHAGYQDGGESHFRVVIAADGLDEMSRIARHRAVHDAIGKDLLSEIHALALVVQV